MMLRRKILALSLALLAILCVALFVSLRMQQEVHDEIATGNEYHLPLGVALAEAEVAALGVQLELARSVGPVSAVDADAVEQRAAKLMAVLASRLDAADALAARAIADPRNDVGDRIALAQLEGTLRLIRREVSALEGARQTIVSALRSGDAASAASAMAVVARFERVVGEDLDRMRRSIEKLSQDSVDEIAGHERSALRFSLLLFGAAALVALVVAGVIASRLVQGLLRLVDGANRFQSGAAVAPIPVTTRDEVGQLTEVFNTMVTEIAAKDRIRDTFGRFVDPRVVASLIEIPADATDVAERRAGTVFFSDVAGFSAISEQLTASAVVNLLNRWFDLSAEAIRAHHGVVDKFIGDAVMAFWVPPFVADGEHARRACLAALEQRRAIATLREELPHILGLRRQVPAFDVRMGLATGDLVVGTIGGRTAKSYTAIGDIVNLASRLEGVNKAYGTAIVVAEETWRGAEGAVEGRELDVVLVEGKTEPVRIYEILGAAGELTSAERALCERWAEALDAYRRRDWAAAQRALAACRAVAPEDGPARALEARVARFADRPPDADWDGTWRLAKS